MRARQRARREARLLRKTLAIASVAPASPGHQPGVSGKEKVLDLCSQLQTQQPRLRPARLGALEKEELQEPGT